MRHVILQPCADETAQKNYAHTIAEFVPLDGLLPQLTTGQRNKIEGLYPDGKLWAWGVEDGKNGVNHRRWLNLKPGDIVFFAWKKSLHSRACVTGTLSSETLSEYLWGDKKYRNIYLLNDLEYVNIPYSQLNRAAGYKKNYCARGFQVLSKEKSARVLETFSLTEGGYEAECSAADCSAAIQKLHEKEGSLDRSVQATRREEQELLRRYLFGGVREKACALCGKRYPVEFLATAHIKRRESCSPEERKDVAAIVMPACKFGCDELYERGYLLVVDGKVVPNDQKWFSETLREYVNAVAGRDCPYWNEATQKYFQEHSARFRR